MFRKVAVLALALLPFSIAQISDGFENGWDQTKWPIYAPDCNQGGAITLDSTVAHSGKNSLKVAGAGGYCGHIFFGTTEVPTGDLYVRVWLLTNTALTSDHVSFMTMTDAAQSAGDNLRIGGQDQVLMYNREEDDATLPDMSPQGTATSEALPTGSWQCFEYHIGTDGTIQTWLNSELIPGLEFGPGISNPNSNGWSNKAGYVPKITGVYMGWESYGGGVNTFWYDDVSIQSTRIGCAVSGSTGGTGTTTKPASASPTTLKTTTTSAPASTPVPTCSVAKYGQCGGTGYIGCTSCAAGSTCIGVSPPYYSQCQ